MKATNQLKDVESTWVGISENSRSALQNTKEYTNDTLTSGERRDGSRLIRSLSTSSSLRKPLYVIINSIAVDATNTI